MCVAASSSQIKLLLRKGVKWSALTKNQFSALHLAAYRVFTLSLFDIHTFIL
jgi:hypothetical protein